MLRLLRKLMGSGTSRSAAEPRVIKSATSEILAKSARLRETTSGPAALPQSSAQEFDPYNTGAFNRSASWERIGKRKL